MARRRIRPDADEDLNQTWSFIAVNNPKAADATIDRLSETFDMLLTMPLAGRARREFGETFGVLWSTTMSSFMRRSPKVLTSLGSCTAGKMLNQMI